MSATSGSTSRSMRTTPMLGVSPPPAVSDPSRYVEEEVGYAPLSKDEHTSKRSPGTRWGAALASDASGEDLRKGGVERVNAHLEGDGHCENVEGCE
jgi:hypothetical protein